MSEQNNLAQNSIEILLWIFAPDIITTILVNMIHRILYRSEQQPKSGTKKHYQHYRLATYFLCFMYIGYKILECYLSLNTYYHFLGVTKLTSQSEIKKAFIRLSKENHPDKYGENIGYLNIRNSYEVLIRPNLNKVYSIYGNLHMERQIDKNTNIELFGSSILASILSVYSPMMVFVGMGAIFKKRIEYWKINVILSLLLIQVYHISTPHTYLASLLDWALISYSRYDQLVFFQVMLSAFLIVSNRLFVDDFDKEPHLIDAVIHISDNLVKSADEYARNNNLRKVDLIK